MNEEHKHIVSDLTSSHIQGQEAKRQSSSELRLNGVHVIYQREKKTCSDLPATMGHTYLEFLLMAATMSGVQPSLCLAFASVPSDNNLFVKGHGFSKNIFAFDWDCSAPSLRARSSPWHWVIWLVKLPRGSWTAPQAVALWTRSGMQGGVGPNPAGGG